MSDNSANNRIKETTFPEQQSVDKSRPQYTNDEKALAFEWLRQRALSTEEGAKLACIALTEWAALKAATSSSAVAARTPVNEAVKIAAEYVAACDRSDGNGTTLERDHETVCRAVLSLNKVAEQWFDQANADAAAESSASTVAPQRETLERTRERFEQWFKMTYPLFRDGRDTTLKHQLWTAWQVANSGAIGVNGSKT